MKNVEPMTAANNSNPAVQMFLSMNGTGSYQLLLMKMENISTSRQLEGPSMPSRLSFPLPDHLLDSLKLYILFVLIVVISFFFLFGLGL
jgi:hypothetical protein